MGARVGHPTMYRDVLFRSRLEAQWAAFFDLVRWPWEYETLELRGYLPDFVLPFAPGPLLLEVKPSLYREELADACRKIEQSAWKGEAIVVGASPRLAPRGERPGAFGLMIEAEGGMGWDNAVLFLCRDCERVSVRHEGGDWRCRASDCEGQRAPELVDVERLWNEARAATRWEAKGGER